MVAMGGYKFSLFTTDMIIYCNTTATPSVTPGVTLGVTPILQIILYTNEV
jgi:hypothetical protein